MLNLSLEDGLCNPLMAILGMVDVIGFYHTIGVY